MVTLYGRSAVAALTPQNIYYIITDKHDKAATASRPYRVTASALLNPIIRIVIVHLSAGAYLILYREWSS